MFLKIVNGVLISTYSLSSLITILNNACSNNRIRRKGFIIKSIDENSISENIKYFIKDFGFLFVPIYNLIHSIKDTIKNDSEFDEVKMSKLRDRDRLVEYHEPKVVKEEKKVIEPVKEEKKNVEPKKEESKVEEPKKEAVEEKKVSKREPEEKRLEEIEKKRDFYRREYDRELYLRTKLKNEGASVTILNDHTSTLRYIVGEYKKYNSEYEAELLKKAESNISKGKVRRLTK